MNAGQKQSIITRIVFLATLVIVLLNLISAIFPSLIIRLTSTHESTINPLEIGIWAFPILATNLVLLAIAILYWGKSLPPVILKSIKFIINFEISRKIAIIAIIILLGIFIGSNITEIMHSKEESWPDFIQQQGEISTYTLDKFSPLGYPMNYLLLNMSLNVFGNVRIIPFIASICLLILTYYITVEISKKRFAGIVSMAILLQSPLFLLFSTTSTYANFWILFYLFSLYSINKKWYLSPISYVLSILAKPLTTIFLPMTFFFIYRSVIPKKTKKIIVIPYVTFILFRIIFVIIGFHLETSGFHYAEFIGGLASMSVFLRFDGLILIFLLPLIIGLYLVARRGVIHADSLMVLIGGIIISSSLLPGFTFFTNQPYRLVPLIVFFAISVGTLLSKNLVNRSKYSP